MVKKYQLTATDAILRVEDQAWIPADPLNRDYDEYLTWIEEGNEPDPYEPPAPPPEPTPLEKLEAAGLTVPELKALLGIK
jgi:hypothetical protein